MSERILGLPHLRLPYVEAFEAFRRPGTGGARRPSWVPDRQAHALALQSSMRAALAFGETEMAKRAGRIPINANGYYLTVQSRVGEPLLADQLESRRAGVELLSVQISDSEDVVNAQLFIPESAKELLPEKLEQYRTMDSARAKTPTPLNRNLVDGIQSFHGAKLRDLWIDAPSLYPINLETIRDWEVWLRPGKEEVFRDQVASLDIEIGSEPLTFPEDLVFWMRCSLEQVEALCDLTVSIARFGFAKKNSTFSVSASLPEQWKALEDVVSKIEVVSEANCAVCVLDTGAGLHHPLLDLVVSHGDCHAYRPSWGVTDHHGHGTKMIGLSLLGDLHSLPSSAIVLSHVLESVKVHPPAGTNAHELLGAITAGGIARAEMAAPNRARVFCLATSTDEDTPHRGRPTSWSAELDQLASGSETGSVPRRLLCVSVGNIRTLVKSGDYGALNDLAEAESPSQSWNALSVGAMTHKDTIVHPSYDGWSPMAPLGNLSPTSRTASWSKTWPIKPDVVMEGGNLGVDPSDSYGYGIDELLLATVSNDYPLTIFESVAETSAATALASRLCAMVMSAYPSLWPETVRALIVDSAYWTASMLSLLSTYPSKGEFLAMLRRYGFGTPDESRALESGKNDLTMIEECDLQPFIKEDSSGPRLNQMKVFKLPWPRQELEQIGQQTARLKVTLSYFIEPNPAEGARNRPARYASHGFRFAVMNADESFDEFRKRVNKAARDEDDSENHASDAFWKLGPKIRNRGSLHSDVWEGPAADLARRGAIAVFPVGGWWKDRTHLERFNDRARFALVVRLEVPTVDVDLYTPVATALETMVTTAINVE